MHAVSFSPSIWPVSLLPAIERRGRRSGLVFASLIYDPDVVEFTASSVDLPFMSGPAHCPTFFLAGAVSEICAYWQLLISRTATKGRPRAQPSALSPVKVGAAGGACHH